MGKATDALGPTMRRHPAKLYPLALSELLERFAFFGMQGLLSLYLAALLAGPEGGASIWGWAALAGAIGGESGSFQIASTFFGLATGLAYLATIAGGWLADRHLGRPRTIVLGAVLGLAGYLALAVEATFLVGVILVIAGSGAFKGNIVSEVSALYRPQDPRREDGFRLFFIAINLGILAAPLVCGTLAEAQGWRWGFLAAACGMAASLVAYLATAGGAIARRARAGGATRATGGAKPWSPERAVAFAVVLLVLGAAFTGTQQIYNAYLGWASRSLQLSWGGLDIPTTWLLAIDTAAQLLMLSLVTALWAGWRRVGPEPEPLVKIGLGCGLVALAYVCLAAVGRGQAVVDLALILAFHAANSLGFAIILPVGLAFLTSRAREGARSTMVGLYYLQFAFGSFTAGILGRWLDVLPTPAFWLLHAGVLAAAGATILATRKWIAAALRAPQGAPELAGAAEQPVLPSASAKPRSANPSVRLPSSFGSKTWPMLKSYAGAAASPTKAAAAPLRRP